MLPSLLFALVPPLLPQEPGAPAATLPASDAHKLSWPRDRERVIGVAGGREVRLHELVRHVDERHFPGYTAFLDGDAGRFELQSPIAARWVRQYLDVLALQGEARARELPPAETETVLAAALKNGFDAWLQQYAEQRRKQGIETPLDESDRAKLLVRYQKEFGLECEFQGWLDALVPDRFTSQELYDYYTGHARELGGVVDLAHILVHHRDPATGELLPEAGQRVARERVAEIRARLAKDGSNFADVARALSQDRRTAERGGTLARVRRFDPRLPAELCRTAWRLHDGEVAGPVETAYGLHFVRRLRFTQLSFPLYTKAFEATVREHLRWHRQEELLFRVRQEQAVQLRY